MIRALIIDDEENARGIIREYLEDHPEVVVEGEYADGFSAFRAIQELNPGLLFLDIQMPKLTGFEMLELMDKKPEIIFATAYDQYAIKAFEQNAVDYLLKPFSKARFDDALKKAKERIRDAAGINPAGKLAEAMERSGEPLGRMVFKSRTGIRVASLDQVIFIEAQDDYTMVYLKDEKYLKQKTMQYFEDHLPGTDFLRVHRSYIVRLDQISRVEPYEKSSGIIVLKDGRKVPVSRAGLARLKDALDR